MPLSYLSDINCTTVMCQTLQTLAPSVCLICGDLFHPRSYPSLHEIADEVGVIKLTPFILMRDEFGRTCFVAELTMGLAKADIG